MKEQSRRWTLWLGAALLLALAVRWIYWNQAHELPLYQTPTGDAATYIDMARAVHEQGILAPQGAPYQQAPLYGWFLALLNAMGFTLGGVRWAQYLLGVGAVGLAAVLARRWGGNAAGICAAFVGAIYGPWIFFEGELLSISLAVFLLLAGLVLLNGLPLVAGLLFGMATLTQPTAGGAAWLMTAAGLWRPGLLRLSSRRSVVLLGIGLLIPVTASLVRNVVETGEPILVSVNGGINYFIGNNQQASGIFHLPPDSGLINRPDGLFTSAREVAEARSGSDLSVRAVDREWWLKGFDYWLTQPGSAISLWARKLLLTLNHFEVPNHFDYDYIKTRAPILRLLPAWGLMFPLAIAGMVILWRRRDREPTLWLVALTLLVVMFFVTGRYRLPLTAVLIPASGVFLATAWGARRRVASLLPWPAAGLAAGLLVAWIPIIAGNSISTAHMLNLEGITLASRGDLAGAEQAFRRVLELNPNHAEALNNIGRMLVLQRRSNEALPLYQRAMAADPTQAETYFNLEELYRQSGQYQNAEEMLNRLEQARAGRIDDIAYGLAYRRGLIATAVGDSTAADQHLSQAVNLDASQPAAAAALTRLRQTGAVAATPERIEKARMAAQANPSNPDSMIAYGRMLAASGRYQPAIEALIAGWQQRPKDPEPLLDIGSSYLALGDSAQAAAHWYKANENRVHPPSLLALAGLMEAQGKTDAAIAAYKILVERAGGTPESKQAQNRLAAIGRGGAGTP